MKNLLMAILLLFSSCITSKNSSTKTFKLTKAEKQSYVLGMRRNDGTTSGITHSLFFDYKGDVKIIKLWINGVNIDFEEAKIGENSKRIQATFYGGTKRNIHEDIKEPIEYDGKALVQYKENDEIKYLIVKEFKTFAKGGLAN